jgi:hypothetical protein
VIRLSNLDDMREDLELAVMELQDNGVSPSSIRRFVNSAIRATTDVDGIRATKFLRMRWKRDQDAFEHPSRPVGNAASSPRSRAAAGDGLP